jgi:hypothetical protein
MLWLLAFATGDDFSEGAEVPAGSTPAGPPLSADSSGAEFVSGAVIALSTALPLSQSAWLRGAGSGPHLQGGRFSGTETTQRWPGHRDYLVAGMQKLFCSAQKQMYAGPQDPAERAIAR